MTKNELQRWVADNVLQYCKYYDHINEQIEFNVSGFTEALWSYWISQSDRRPSHGDQ